MSIKHVEILTSARTQVLGLETTDGPEPRSRYMGNPVSELLSDKVKRRRNVFINNNKITAIQ